MPTIGSLLIATDFSPEAHRAARRAVTLAREGGAARVVLMHVLGRAVPAGLEKRVAELVERKLSERAADLGAGERFAVETRFGRGNAVDHLESAAGEFDLVVAGARGADPLLDLTIGRTSERLARRSPVPVLLAKSEPAVRYAKVLAAVDFSPACLVAARFAARLAPAAEFTFVHAFEVEFESTLRLAGVADEQVQLYRRQARERAAADMDRFVGETGLPPAQVWRRLGRGYAPRMIAEEAQGSGADLIAIGKHARPPLEALLLGSVALEVMRRASCDVLVVPGA